MARAETKRLIAQARQALMRGAADYALILLGDAHEAAPKDAGAACLFADALLEAAQPMTAIEVLAAHLAASPRSAEAARRLSDIFAAVTPVSFATVSAAGLAAALRLDRVAADPLGRAAGLLLAERGERAAFAPGTDEAALLLALLDAAPVRQPALEGWLVARRRAALDGLSGPAAPQDEALLAAMARQVWLNEAVWPAGEAERAAVGRLDLADPAARGVAALYLSPDAWCPPADGAPGIDMPRSLVGLAADINRERHAMARAEAALGPAAGVSDPTGAAVAAQYEANPYPRWGWVQAPPGGRKGSGAGPGAGPGAGRRRLARIAGRAAAPADDWTKGPLRIVVAGCGTGQEAVQAALAYAPDARLLAFDFSRASLRYAAMKARQHGLKAIRFRQADILDLPHFEPPFDRPADLIECIGVLHHMADPFAGWRILLDRLRPGGLMYVGLYSATARRGLTALREKLAGAGIDPADPDAIRAVRARILARPEDHFERALAESADFYTLSEVRDLLFHAHETPLTLEAIGEFLEGEGLDFRHMDVRPHIAEAFAESPDGGPGDAAARDLRAWAAFERDNPDTFDGMYLFWVRKPG
ncbi:MAG: class I SAM-dependent methyltransferase [Rhodospirillaceae bacterium]|nr:class I SAM-dependent methyltransferase [Rhodospirillaceae bacterium]MYI48908.1 class I SAM-dependent methyltransferase [Rhodospirillaceae bacterium]